MYNFYLQACKIVSVASFSNKLIIIHPFNKVNCAVLLVKSKDIGQFRTV